MLLGNRVAADAIDISRMVAADRDLLHMAQGQSHPQKLFNIGRVSFEASSQSVMFPTLTILLSLSLASALPATPPPCHRSKSKATSTAACA